MNQTNNKHGEIAQSISKDKDGPPKEFDIFSSVEPFSDLEVEKIRKTLIKQEVIESQKLALRELIDASSSERLVDSLVGVLAEINAKLHYLNAAYIKHVKDEAQVNNKPNNIARKSNVPDSLKLDLRGDITGGNWWGAEPDGRWAGPENHSSLLVPALNAGQYSIGIEVIDEIQPGIIDGMHFTINRKPVILKRETEGLPTSMVAKFEVTENYKFPFWSLGFSFPFLGQPNSSVNCDSRTLAIRVKTISIKRDQM